MALDVHVVTHTHWDREWYQPLERFRQRLVTLVDNLLDDPPAVGESFLLDGQSIIVEDYLAVRPERTNELRALLHEGRLEAGPWYVLADELIPGGEALVRNLFAGRRVLRRFGATAPPVLYCPDSFGHPASLPSIAAGFGLATIILWRGYGGPRWPIGDAVRWAAPNGDVVTLYHLPRDGYEFGSHLPTDRASAQARWQRMRAELVPRSTTGVVLVPSGADHHARQPDFRESLAALEQAGLTDDVHRSTLRQFAERLAAEASTRSLAVVHGELRDSYGYTWTLQGTFATRAHEKRLNAIAERLLLRDAEPWAALAARATRTRRHLVEHAWRTLLAAHPHDTLCGCSIDDVADAMELRLRSAVHQGEGIRDDAIADLIGYDAAVAREARDRWTPIVVLRNPAPRQRSGVAIVEIEEFIADVPVGPNSAPTSPSAVATAPSSRAPVVDGLGRLQVLSRDRRYSRTESPHHYPDNDLVAVTRVAAWVTDCPAYGLVAYPIATREAPRRRFNTPRVVARGLLLENDALTLAVLADGSVTLTDRESGRGIESLFTFVDEADVGDLYTPAPRPRQVAIEYRGAKGLHRGPLRAELALRYRVVDKSAARRLTDVELTVHLVLDAGARFVGVAITGDNRRADHRLRLMIRTGIAPTQVWADAAFGCVRRERLHIGPNEAAVEAAPPTDPLHRYVSVFNDTSGCTLFSDGLAEYEARDDGSLLVTLVRSVGQLSRNDIPERPGHAGWPVPTPKAECLGPFAATLAVMLHGPRDASTIGAIERTADDLLSPLAGVTMRSALHVPAPVRGVELVGAGLAFSTVKESEDGQWLVLRCVNLLDHDVSGSWRVPFEVIEARLARLDETPSSVLVADGGEVLFHAEPRAIVTILVR
ncbi:MAG TPA: glycosyl hydrolase-related protein [Acidimicrobiia bacterium]|nr:glycosyl hydrolase-related protein [Acidimicrobiia bacterium]